jgi:pantoate--beta-alanine ligase
MWVVANAAELRAARAAFQGVVGLVPTMGALHAAHMALVAAAHEECDVVVVTIFVNPTQFGPDDDLASYPRTLARDLAMLEAEGVDLVFTPTPEVMYPPGYQTTIRVGEVARPLEGVSRPGHFVGVATVVAKLFNLVQPDRGYFGQKDAQQVVVLRRMVADLNFPLTVVPVPTVREADGLAMSSRNAYLSDGEREAALVLSRALGAAADAYEAGERGTEVLRGMLRGVIMEEPLAEVDYISIADPRTLDEVQGTLRRDAVVLVSLTVQLGKPRLLDNMLLPRALNTRDGLMQHLGVS